MSLRPLFAEGASRRPRPAVIGHRGAPARAPENSLASFALAVAAGGDAVETDLWVTSDGELVCHHDRELGRTTDSGGSIPALDLAEVRQARVVRSEYGDFAAAFAIQRVPTLDELLAAIPDRVGVALELKDPAFAEPLVAAALAELMAARIDAGTVMLLSFHRELLEAAREAAPGVWVGLIFEHEPHPVFAGNGVGTTPLAMQSNPAWMDEARRQGLWVCPLDTRPEPRLPWYLELGVDAVLSDDPATTIAALAALGAR